MPAIKPPCTRLASALHLAVVELAAARLDALPSGTAAAALAKLEAEDNSHWLDTVGRHVALAIAAIPNSVLRDWLMDARVVGGEEIYKTLKAGARIRAAGGDSRVIGADTRVIGH